MKYMDYRYLATKVSPDPESKRMKHKCESHKRKKEHVQIYKSIAHHFSLERKKKTNLFSTIRSLLNETIYMGSRLSSIIYNL